VCLHDVEGRWKKENVVGADEGKTQHSRITLQGCGSKYTGTGLRQGAWHATAGLLACVDSLYVCKAAGGTYSNLAVQPAEALQRGAPPKLARPPKLLRLTEGGVGWPGVPANIGLLLIAPADSPLQRGLE
jgi:hypothetical protein